MAFLDSQHRNKSSQGEAGPSNQPAAQGVEAGRAHPKKRTPLPSGRPKKTPGANNQPEQAEASSSDAAPAPGQSGAANCGDAGLGITGIQPVILFTVKAKESYTIQLSLPARGEDVDKFRADHQRHQVQAHVEDQANPNQDPRLVQWHTQIRPLYWRGVVDRFRPVLPRGVDEGALLRLLSKSHPCIRDPFSGHALHKEVLGKHGKVRKLRAWVCGSGERGDGEACPAALPHPTWRETMAAKARPADRAVPSVSREEIVGVWILLKRARLDEDVDRTEQTRRKWDLVRDCRLAHLVSGGTASASAPEPFWLGYEEELREAGERARAVPWFRRYVARLEGFAEDFGLPYEREEVVVEGEKEEEEERGEVTPADFIRLTAQQSRLICRIRYLEGVFDHHGVALSDGEEEDEQ